MDVTPVLTKGAPAIESYGPEGIRVSGQLYEGPVFLSVQDIALAHVKAYANVSIDDLQAIFAHPSRPDILLLGVGLVCESLPPKAWREAASMAGVVMEAMSTAAACRTWNVLLSEGRRACALLFPA